MKKTPLIPNFKPFMPRASIRNAVKVLRSGWIGGDGPYGKEFEAKIGEIIGNRNVVAVNSGTSALQLALRLANVQGGEVITSPMTCIATNAAIVNEGGIPVWADIDPTTGNINASDIEKRISKKTKAIMVVHWGGAPADLSAIRRVAKEYNLPVIEDAAQALGSTYNGKPLGSHSEFVAFSTQAIKVINTIDGGLLATKYKRDVARARRLRWYGIDRQKRQWNNMLNSWEFDVSEVGYKMQLTDVQAAIGLGQLSDLSSLIERRRKLAHVYEQALLHSKTLTAQRILPGSQSNYWMFTVICNTIATKIKLIKEFKKISVQVETGHVRNDIYSAFKIYSGGVYPGVTHFNDCHVIIPVGQWVPVRKAQEIAAVLSAF